MADFGIARAVTAAPAEQLDLLVHPDNVAAIEVFPSPAGVPVQYNNRGSACGVILVWTRR